MANRFPKSRVLTLCAVSVLVMAAAAPAFAQDVDSRLSRMENEIQTLSRAVFKGETPPSGAVPSYDAGSSAAGAADIELRLSQMERAMADLTGRVEQQDYELRRMQDQLDKALADVTALAQDRLAATGAPPQPPQTAAPLYNGTGAGMESAPLTASAAAPDHTLGTLTQSTGAAPASPVDMNDPDGLYAHAFALLQGRHYDEAEQEFADFLKRFPDHRLAGNAQYWLGETWYVRGDYERAARYFAEGYQKYPDGAKAPDNLLKLGLSLAGMGKKDDACLAFDQILRTQAGGANPILDRTEKERAKLGCP